MTTSRKRVYITGGSSGIGLGLAQFYVRAGSDVVLIARDEIKLDAAVSLCGNLRVDAGQLVAAESVDVTAYDLLADKVTGIVERNGPPDLLILSAGVVCCRTFLNTSAREFNTLVESNFAGSREVARAILPGMLQRRSGQIAFVSSLSGLVGVYGYTAYSASKFAVNGFVQALRQELSGSGVSVHLVCPAEVDTPMIRAEAGTVLPQPRFLKDLIGTLEPSQAAKKIAAGIEKGKAVIIPGFRAGIVACIARLSPGLFAKGTEILLRYRFG